MGGVNSVEQDEKTEDAISWQISQLTEAVGEICAIFKGTKGLGKGGGVVHEGGRAGPCKGTVCACFMLLVRQGYAKKAPRQGALHEPVLISSQSEPPGRKNVVAACGRARRRSRRAGRTSVGSSAKVGARTSRATRRIAHVERRSSRDDSG